MTLAMAVFLYGWLCMIAVAVSAVLGLAIASAFVRYWQGEP